MTQLILQRHKSTSRQKQKKQLRKKMLNARKRMIRKHLKKMLLKVKRRLRLKLQQKKLLVKLLFNLLMLSQKLHLLKLKISMRVMLIWVSNHIQSFQILFIMIKCKKLTQLLDLK
jgi:hypothetical protein